MKHWLLLIAVLAVLAGCTPKDQAQTGNWLNSPPAAGIVLSIRAPMAGSADTLLPQQTAPIPTATPTPVVTHTPGVGSSQGRVFMPLIMAAAAATPTPTPTPCTGGWQQGHESTPPEFAAQLESAFNATFSGTIDSNLFGEWHCGSFGASAMDVHAIIIVADLNQATLSAADAQFTAMMNGLKPWPAPNLGNVRLSFYTGGSVCNWDYSTKMCTSFGPGSTSTPLFTPTPVVSVTPTPVVTNTPTPSVTGTPCGWIQAYRPTPPAFAAQLASAFNGTFSGSISSRLFGETQCAEFYPMALDVVATINVANLNLATLSAADAQFTTMMNGLKPWPAPNLVAMLTLTAPEGTCVWDYQAKECRSITPSATPTP